MHAFQSFLERRGTLSVVLATVMTVFFVFAVAQAATTISTDITTDGNIYATSTLVVDSTVTLNGSTITLGNSADDVLTVTANASTSNALSVGGWLYVNGYATTTGTNGNFATDGTIDAAGAVTFTSTLTVSGDVTLDTTDIFADVSADSVGFGTTTLTYPFVVNRATSTFAGSDNTASSTVYIYDASDSSVGGQIILEDTDGAGCTVLSAINGVLVADTIACPAE